MPQPININSVPISYFLHGVDAVQEAQNAQAPGGVQPEAEGEGAGAQGRVNAATEMVRQLDVLLVKAAKTSTQSLDGKTVKNSLQKLVDDGALDKNSLKLLAKTADTAAKTLKALDKFTGAQLAAAIKSGSGEKGSFAQIDAESKAGKAVKAAIDAQNALSDMFAQLDRQLGAMERNDGKMRAAYPNYKGVDPEVYGFDDKYGTARCRTCARSATAAPRRSTRSPSRCTTSPSTRRRRAETPTRTSRRSSRRR